MRDTWEWELEDGAKIIAKLELPSYIESVWLGARLISRSKAGGKGDAHIVPLPAASRPAPKSGDVYREAPAPREADVLFDPLLAECTLRIDGAVVRPTRVPDPEALLPPPVIPRRILGMPIARFAIVAGVAASVAIVAIVPPAFRGMRERAARAKIADAPAETDLTNAARAADGSITARFPGDFSSNVDRVGAVITLTRPAKLETVVLVSMPRTDLDDPADLDRIMMQDLAAHATKSGAVMSTTITREADCRSFPGVMSTATVTKPDKRDDIPLKVVGCTTLRNGRGYFFAYYVPEFIVDAEEAALRRIVDATEVIDFPTAAELATRAPAGSFNGNGNSASAFANAAPEPSRFVFSSQGFGAVPTARPVPQPQPRSTFTPRPPPGRPPSLPTPGPAPTLQFNANGSVEYSGPANNRPRH